MGSIPSRRPWSCIFRNWSGWVLKYISFWHSNLPYFKKYICAKYAWVGYSFFVIISVLLNKFDLKFVYRYILYFMNSSQNIWEYKWYGSTYLCFGPPLFAITCPKRGSSMSSLNLHHYRLLPEGLVFTLTVANKTTRPDETVEAFFTRFPEDSNLCPVELFNTYLSSTSRLRNLSEAERSNNLFVSYIKPHQPVTTASLPR